MFSGKAQVSCRVCQFCVSSCVCDIGLLAGKLMKLYNSLSELRSSLCERQPEMTVLRPVLLPFKMAQVTQFTQEKSDPCHIKAISVQSIPTSTLSEHLKVNSACIT
jgi:hypothetical protein